MDLLRTETPPAEAAAQTGVYTAPGMPPLDMRGRQTSFFEFWPMWVMYLPVALQSLAMALWHRSLTLPLIANPGLPLSGMVGVEKSRLLGQARGQCRQAILPWFLHSRTGESLDDQIATIASGMVKGGFSWPVVCKPDIGCRGSGVKLVHNSQQLARALDCYPQGAGMMVQALASWEPEAGVFYIRHPDQVQGEIVSLALKYTPYVVGDGRSTLRELIVAGPRAKKLQHIYARRHRARLDEVVARGEPYRLVFSASHCRGAIFRDAKHYITPELTTRIDALMRELPEFYYGRLDIKFRDIESFQRGENIEIVEVNSASSESLHIWDRNTPFREAVRSLLFQYRTLFRLGARNRERGFRPPSAGELLDAWKKERSLTRVYPETD